MVQLTLQASKIDYRLAMVPPELIRKLGFIEALYTLMENGTFDSAAMMFSVSFLYLIKFRIFKIAPCTTKAVSESPVRN